MVLYHGTNVKSAENIKKRGVLLERCNDFTDFGKGFYTSKYEQFAEITAINKSLKSKARGIDIVPAIVLFEFDEKAFSELNCCQFEKNDVKWLQFITNNRNGIHYVNSIFDDFHNLYAKFDIVCGGVADGDVVLFVENCLFRKAKVSSFDIKSILFEGEISRYSHQTSFHTERALQYLKFVDYKEVTL